MPRTPHHSEFTSRDAQLTVTRVESTIDPGVWADVIPLGGSRVFVMLMERAETGERQCGATDSGNVERPFSYWIAQAAKLVAERVAIREVRTTGIPRRAHCPACGMVTGARGGELDGHRNDVGGDCPAIGDAVEGDTDARGFWVIAESMRPADLPKRGS